MGDVTEDEKQKIDAGVKKLVRFIWGQSFRRLLYFHPPTFLSLIITICAYFMVKDPAFATTFQLPSEAAYFVTEKRALILGVMMVGNAIAIFNASVFLCWPSACP